jgi:tRNA G18 (ribose-2'-O)-methylase SpoU
MVELHSLDDPRIAEYRFLPERTGRLDAGERTIVESEVVVRRLLQHPWSAELIESALIEHGAAERLVPLLQARGVPPERIFLAPKSMVERVVGYPLHRGVFLCMRVPARKPLSEVPLPAVLLVGVSNSTNVGAIARSAAAFGFRTLICDRQSASPWLRRCIRVSMGAVFELSLYHATEPTEQLVKQLRERGGRLIGAEVGAPEVYTAVSWSRRDVLVFGSEGSGLSAAFLRELDVAVRIPISAAVESLNVAAAAAIICAEHAKQCGQFMPEHSA